MACPYFLPVERLENGSWPHPARLPLGCGWAGQCTAPGHDRGIPEQGVLEAYCNLGYARGCNWAPQDRQQDAVRFAILPPEQADRQNPGAGSSAIRLRYACERDHRPVVHGELEFDLERARWNRPHEDMRLQKMAECFLESYLNKKS